MKNFSIRPEIRTACYSIQKKHRALKTAAAAVCALSVLNGCSFVVIGMPAYSSSSSASDNFQNLTDAVSCVEQMLTNALPGSAVTRGVQMALTDGTNAIDFRADGYISNLNIAFKITDPSLAQDTGTPQYELEFNESQRIVNYMFHTNWILELPTASSNSITTMVRYFIQYYTNAVNP